MRNTQRERQRHRQREKQAPCRELDARLDPDPGTLGSRSESKADAELLSHPGILITDVLKKSFAMSLLYSELLED